MQFQHHTLLFRIIFLKTDFFIEYYPIERSASSWFLCRGWYNSKTAKSKSWKSLLNGATETAIELERPLECSCTRGKKGGKDMKIMHDYMIESLNLKRIFFPVFAKSISQKSPNFSKHRDFSLMPNYEVILRLFCMYNFLLFSVWSHVKSNNYSKAKVLTVTFTCSYFS